MVEVSFVKDITWTSADFLSIWWIGTQSEVWITKQTISEIEMLVPFSVTSTYRTVVEVCLDLALLQHQEDVLMTMTEEDVINGALVVNWEGTRY